MQEPIIYYRDITKGVKEEIKIASKYFKAVNQRTLTGNNLVIPRYSMIPNGKELEKDIEILGGKLINSYHQHRYVADLSAWYLDLENVTPRTYFSLEELPRNGGPFIVKGETNSVKFRWNSHMYAKNKTEAKEIFLKLQEDSFFKDQNIYFRDFVPLVKLGQAENGLPISKEFRFFCYKNEILASGFYWNGFVDLCSESEIPNVSEVPEKFIKSVIEIVQENINFYVVDVAQTQNRDWIVVELNDGTQSGPCGVNVDELYSNLRKFLDLENEN